MTASEPFMKVKSKIVVTVGPACESADLLRQLVLAGADVFRLNFAHGTHEWHTEAIRRIRALSAELKRPLAVLQDLAGPKIRLGPVHGGAVQAAPDEMFTFAAGTPRDDPHWLTITCPEVLADLAPGNRILLADGTVSLDVTEKHADVAVCRVIQGGEIRTAQGVNLPGIDLRLPSLTPKDLADLDWTAGHDVDFVGLSFVRRPEDVALLRDALRRRSSQAQIVAKIEKPEAVDHLDRIVAAADAVMVARGDLGVEIDLARVPAVQKQIIQMCNQALVPAIVATQMLDSMRNANRPTRAETSDVANAVLDGADCLMLSGETAIGRYPVESVATMSRIAHEAERLLDPRLARFAPVSTTRVGHDSLTEAVVRAAAQVAQDVEARLIVVATHTGQTALALSKQRNFAPTLAVSDLPQTVRRMCLYWGVTPLEATELHDSPAMLNQVIGWALDQGAVHRGDRVVMVASTRWTATRHNMVLVHEVE